jgi:hypothetical protein
MNNAVCALHMSIALQMITQMTCGTWDCCSELPWPIGLSPRESASLPVPCLLQNPEFTPESVGKVSLAARGLCLWVRAMETYGHVAKEVAPKRAKLKAAQVGYSANACRTSALVAP